MESLVAAGVDDPKRYIRFYNLRNYDRLNVSSTMGQAERESGVPYEEARRQHDDRVERPRDEDEARSGYGEQEGYGRQDDYGRREEYGRQEGYDRQDDYNRDSNQPQETSYTRYQSAATHTSDQTLDTVASAYMSNGPSLPSLPWTGTPESELFAFVSEELYIHSKVLIADDRLVICGSANLNDRSQLGDHDSEIAVVIEDPTPIDSRMAGQPYTASRFAAGLRRQLFRKHLGLLKHQAPDGADGNWTPIDVEGNVYDWGSEADRMVEDPLDERLLELWNGTARTNTDVFSKVFHPVPNDRVRSWEEYDQFFSRHFIMPGTVKEEEDKQRAEGRVDYGHVVREEFPGGVGEVKEWLRRVRGTLVEMPLDFLVDVPDLAKEGLSLNSLTDDLYT